MASAVVDVLSTSIVKKQIVAVTGLVLIGYVLGHLAGNFLIFGGPEAINGYSERLHSLGPLLWLVRAFLLAMLIAHIWFTVQIVLENRRARGTRYAVRNDFGETNWVKKTMIYTGILVFFFLFIHLADFTFPEKAGPGTIVAGKGEEELGLYGLVWNSFLVPWRVVLYIAAVWAVGLHLSHGIQSFLQTLGMNDELVLPKLRRASVLIGILIAIGYTLIPLYVLVSHYGSRAGV